MKKFINVLIGYSLCTTLSIACTHATTNHAHDLNASAEKMHFGDGGTAIDLQQARQLYEQAAALGSSVAANHLGRMYRNGEGVPQDLQKAKQWYKKSSTLDPSFENKCANENFADKSACALLWAAKAGSAPAQYQLGALYEENQTAIGGDLSQAFEWYLKAAQQGYAKGINALVRCYEKGLGVGQNHWEANFWRQQLTLGS